MREEEAPDPADVVSWEERRLCPDGSCLGVVGADGACNECGRVDPEAARRLDELAAKGERAAAQSAAKSEESTAAVGEPAAGGDGEGAGASATGSGAAGASAGEPGDDWQRRQLCEDGACIGVVIDGRCNTCGKAQ